MSEDAKTFADGERVVTPDGRRGKVLWTISSGRECALALDGEPRGTWHFRPEQLRRESELPPDDQKASAVELAATRDLMREFTACIARRIDEGRVTHEDVISACMNLAAHHANKLGMRGAEFISHAYEAFVAHNSDRAKGGV